MLHLKFADVGQLIGKVINRLAALIHHMLPKTQRRPCREFKTDTFKHHVRVSIGSSHTDHKVAIVLIQNHRQHGIIGRKRQRGVVLGSKPYHVTMLPCIPMPEARDLAWRLHGVSAAPR